MGWKPTTFQSPLTTKGDVHTYDTVDARLGVGSNDHVLTADSAQTLGIKWAAAGGGGQTVPDWVVYLIERLAGETGHTDDDFFASDSSGDYTEQTVSGSATWTIDHGLLSAVVDDQSASDAAAFLKSITSASAPMTIETAINMRGIAEDSNTIGLCFTDGTAASSNVAHAAFFATASNSGLRIRGGTLTDLFATLNNTIQQPTFRFFGDTLYIRLAWTAANTWKAAWSGDGVTWTDYGETTDSFTMTPTHFGVYTTTHGGSNPLLSTFHYFRVADSDLVG